MYVMIAYDVKVDARRVKIHNALKDYGTRVQFSVFECRVNLVQYLYLRHRLKKLIAPAEDSVRFYRLCQRCQTNILRIGGIAPDERQTIVI